MDPDTEKLVLTAILTVCAHEGIPFTSLQYTEKYDPLVRLYYEHLLVHEPDAQCLAQALMN
jgi:hypothetical protein